MADYTTRPVDEIIVLEYDNGFISGVNRDGVELAASFRDAMRFNTYDVAMSFSLLCAEYSQEMKEHPEKLHAYRLIGL